MNSEQLRLLLEAELEATAAILEVYARDFDVEHKADDSPLTEADRASHDIILKKLEPTGIPVLSEESAEIPYAERKDWERFWLVDPLDGTKEFIKKNGEFTVNIALIESGVPVMGAVYAPVLNTAYLGVAGEGAWRLLKGTHFHSADDLPGALEEAALPTLGEGPGDPGGIRVVASRSHRNEATEQFIAELEAQYGPAELVSKGSSLKLCLVAEGAADVYPRIAPTMEWDTAAAQAVVEAAGGVVLQHGTDVPLRYNKQDLLNPYFIAAVPGVL
ncbi:3'(2'),5'-bisphosphate nucleotidase CysQ [Kiritimatiella glycovorans]|uniref:3'(2'),5'-bisphosphate nucleotidase CysQ n=1 Tax=Kiritimatiella glycovorans TaxID=1307763 RepID=A0A0G3EN22_9BACT|nr:3'(2'),5'-bisphosphate nucleotidase CysQ [Kiritimatiella glycovorans]AKJ65544.1 3'(2'),5'-bisphosphate nucleotidase CysQ [Kiritimatiella glycovorans]